MPNVAKYSGPPRLQDEAPAATDRVHARHPEPATLVAVERNGLGQRRAGHARHVTHRAQHPFIQGGPLGGREAHAAQVGAREYDAIGVVTKPVSVHVAQAADEQPGANEQYDRQRRLENEQCRSRPAATIRPVARSRLEGAGQVPATGLQCRHESRQQGHDHRGDRGKQQGPAIAGDRYGFVGRKKECAQGRRAPLRNRQPGQSTSHREQEALGQELAHQPGPAHA